MSKLYQEDVETIREYLREYDACDFPVNKREIVPQNVALDTLERILKKGITDGPSMRAVQCLFQTIFSSEKDVKTDEYGVCRLKKGINSWFQNISEINRGSFGIMYKASVIRDNIQVVIKSPTGKIYNQEEFLREYLVGLILNNLRYLVPNFAYTLGIFSCGTSGEKYANQICTQTKDFRDFIVYEKINGFSLDRAIATMKLTVIECIPIIAMILLALEVAQRECRFAHYDLHTANIMLVENMPDYEVVLDDVVYKVTKPKYTPILVDFGTSFVHVSDVVSGISHEPFYTKYLIPNFDMHYLVYSILEQFIQTNPGDSELYLLVQILKTRYEGEKILNHLDPKTAMDYDNIYLAKKRVDQEFLAFSLVNTPGASQTPLQLFKLMYRAYPVILSSGITEEKRTKLYSLKYTSSIQSYYDILGDSNEGIKQTALRIESCIGNVSSFILARYQVYVLENYNRVLKSKSLDKLIGNIKQELIPANIDNDLKDLNNVFESQFLMRSDWEEIVQDVINRMVHQYIWNPYIVTFVTKVYALISNIEPYFDAYYSILELGLDKEYPEKYGKWVNKFTQSDIFMHYTQNLDILTEGLRWVETLGEALNVNKNVTERREAYFSTSKIAEFWGLKPEIIKFWS